MSPEQLAEQSFQNAYRWFAWFEGTALFITLTGYAFLGVCAVMAVLIYRRLGQIQRNLSTPRKEWGLQLPGHRRTVRRVNETRRRKPNGARQWRWWKNPAKRTLTGDSS